MNRFTQGILQWLLRHRVVLKYLSYIATVLAVLTLLIWTMGRKVVVSGTEVNHEPIFIGLTYLVLLFNFGYRILLRESRYIPAHALAFGYVTNFLEPLITQLLENGIKQPLIYVYKPVSISELSKENIDRVKARVINMGFQISETQLRLKHDRARDILTIQKSQTKLIYFDFPNTLISLTGYIEFEVQSKSGESPEGQKKLLATKLINRFFLRVASLLKEKGLSDYVQYCDNSMQIRFG